MISDGTITVNGVNASRITSNHEHVYNQKNLSDEYLVHAANCTQPSEYYYSCECGKAGTETFTNGEALGHDTLLTGVKQATCTEEGYTGDLICKVCGSILESGKTIPKTEHSYTDGVCSVCGKVFEPEIIKGADGTWKKGSESSLPFTSNAEYADFIKVQVDGKDLDGTNYEVEEGSTIVILKASYLETLSPGNHTLTVVSKTGTASATFTIQAEGSSQTTDNNTPADTNSGSILSPLTAGYGYRVFCITLMFISAGIIVAAIIFKTNKNTN